MRKTTTTLIAGLTLVAGLVAGHIATPAAPSQACSSAAFLAYDAYKTDAPSMDLETAMNECADTTGGL